MTKNSKNIQIYYQNVRGLRTKTSDFYLAIASSDSDLFIITETGCNESIYDGELVPPGHRIIRCDRTDGRKQGGAFLVATPHFEMRRITISDNVNIDNHIFEIVCSTVYLRNRFLFLLCAVYTYTA